MKKEFKETKLGKFLASKGLDQVTEIAKAIPGIGTAVTAMDALKDAVLGSKEFSALPIPDRDQFYELHKEQLHELEMYLNDISNARQKEIELAKLGKSNSRQTVLAYAGVGAFFLVVGFLLVKGIREMGTQEAFIIGGVVGTVTSIATMIYAYEFGSSKGSKDNGDALRKAFTDKN